MRNEHPVISYSFKRGLSAFVACLLLIVVMSGCKTVPVTGRKQLALVPPGELQQLSSQQFQQFMEEHKVSQDQERVAMVQEMGRNIQRAVEDYYAKQGMSERLENFDWRFDLIESDQKNAFAMPGGKVVIYSGLLEVAQNRAQLATVMAHEVAHVLARHGNERMSQALLANVGGIALSAALSSEPARTRQLAMAAYGAGATVGVLLPYSRTHEAEADRMGLIFMAKAGYDPREAVEFWQQMMKQKQGGQPPEFLSTHPSDMSRIKNLREHLPKAMEYYRKVEKPTSGARPVRWRQRCHLV